MKRILLPLVAVVALSVSLISCSSNSPKASAEKFLNGLMHYDFEAAKSVADSNTRNMLDMIASFSSAMPDSVKAKSKDIKVDIKDVKEEGDKATVTFVTSKMKEEQTLNLVKENGKWLVKMSKNDSAPAMDAEPMPAEETMSEDTTSMAAPADTTSASATTEAVK